MRPPRPAVSEHLPSTDDGLHLRPSAEGADERLIEFVRALARCAAHRYIADSEKEGAGDAS